MKIIKKVSVLALSALLMLGGAACGDPSKNSDSSSSAPPDGYRDPNTVFTTYDNKSYNEFPINGKDTASAILS